MPAAVPLPRIEMVLPTLEVGGMEVMVAGLVRTLAHRGHDVGVTCLERGGPVADELLAEGYQVRVVPTPGLRTNVVAPALRDWLAARRPDVIHSHSGTWLKAARAAHAAGVPRVIHTVHGVLDPEPWFSPLLMRLASRYTAAAVAVSPSVAEFLRTRVHVPPARLVLQPNGIDVDRFTPGPKSAVLRRRLGLSDDAPLVGLVARLDPLKNHTLLLDAFARVAGRHPDVTLALVGDGPLRSEIEARIGELGLTDRVRLAGEMRDMPAVYRDFDLFALSSRTEGTSISLLEAMASGIPVVATAVGGNPDLLDHGRYGLLTPPGEADPLAAAMEQLLASAERRAALAAAARRHVVDRYSHEAMVGRYQALYRASGPVEAPREEVSCAG